MEVYNIVIAALVTLLLVLVKPCTATGHAVVYRMETDYQKLAPVYITPMGYKRQDLVKDVLHCPKACSCDVKIDVQKGKILVVRDCSGDPTSELATLFAHHPFTSHLRIVSANMASLPCKELSGLSYVDNFDFTGNLIENLYCEHWKRGTWKSMNFSHSMIKRIPYNQVLFQELIFLDLSYNSLSEVPCSMRKMSVLENLDLSHNRIETVPCNMSTMYALQTLNLASNVIKDLPCNLSGIFSLRSLNLSYNNIQNVQCQKVLNVKVLDLSYNNLKSISCYLFTIINLTSLSLSHNYINRMECSLAGLSSLTRFDLSFNNLTTISSHLTGGLGSLRALQYLDLSWNQLTTIPCDLTSLSLLVYLNLSHNALRVIPCNMLEMSALHNLDLSNNRFITTPAYTSTVSNGNTLGLRQNQKCTFHYHLSKLPVIRTYNLIYHLLNFPLNSISLPKENNLNPTHYYSPILRPWGRDVRNSRSQTLTCNITSVILGPNFELRLGNNPWMCDCKAGALKEWLIGNKRNIKDLNDVKCFFPSNTKGKRIIYVDSSEMYSEQFDATPTALIIGAIISFFISCLPLIFMIRIKHSIKNHDRKDWEPVDCDEEADDGKEFDVFVTYANEDEDYVDQYLIPELEKRGFKVCFHRVHFYGGKSIIDNICESIDKSKKILAFYSINYKQSDFGMFEYTLAMQLDVQNGSNRLVTIIDTDLDLEDLKISHSTYLRTHSYISKEEPTFWRTLLHNLPKHKLRGS